jgi:hypothetical protein
MGGIARQRDGFECSARAIVLGRGGAPLVVVFCVRDCGVIAE